MIININNVSKLKQILAEKYGVYLHLHDTCEVQSVSFDDPIGEDVVKCVTEYAEALGGTVKFFPAGDGFTVK